MVLKERAPQSAQFIARGAAGECVERLAALDQQPFAGDVLLLDPHARRVHAAKDRPVATAHDLAGDDAAADRHRRGVLLETRDPRVDARKRPMHGDDGLGRCRHGPRLREDLDVHSLAGPQLPEGEGGKLFAVDSFSKGCETNFTFFSSRL